MIETVEDAEAIMIEETEIVVYEEVGAMLPLIEISIAGGTSRTDIIIHFTCNCGESSIDSTYRQ